MRINGHVIGAFSTTATRRSVICSFDGSEARLTLFCTKLAAASAEAAGDIAAAAPAVSPRVRKNERRSTSAGAGVSCSRTLAFMVVVLASAMPSGALGRSRALHATSRRLHAAASGAP